MFHNGKAVVLNIRKTYITIQQIVLKENYTLLEGDSFEIFNPHTYYT